MNTTKEYQERLEIARKRVDAIKSFFEHVRTFLSVFIILAILYVIKAEPVVRFRESLDAEILQWIDLNILTTLGIWVLVLLIHGLIVFKYRFSFLRKWEERQLEKFMKEEV